MTESPPPLSLNLHEQPCFALFTTANAVTRAYRELLDPLGLTYTQYLVMLSLWERDGVSLHALSAHTLLDSPTLTPVVRRLQAKGLVSRARAGDDVRRLVITVTPAALELRERARPIPDAMLCRVGLSADDERTLGRLLAEMRAALAPAAHIPPDQQRAST
ncbi:MarR family winged helix-turn-helix transcriptional regulator [Tomitella biformata]|uniref:MarR family winged helix-turn-helix transcriptional regulator n=1 Tax=Tomitella biformata TaxID=630403 RepID=UPI000467C7F7|nr:MarR family transcriptional regulator [Tomitella biformata]